MEKSNNTNTEQKTEDQVHIVCDKSQNVDSELDDLLDSALQDFEKTSVKKSQTSVQPQSQTNEDANWDEEFLSQAKMFDEQMTALLKDAGINNVPTPENFTLGLAKMAESAAKVVEGKGLEQVEPQVVDSITQALKGLKEGTDNLQSVLDTDEFAKMFNGLDVNADGDAGANPFMPFVQGMMQSLLSAEVLLPSLKDLQRKFPVWIEENREKISAEDEERYTKQQELFQIIINELEEEKPDDAAHIKNDRFKRVLEHMQKLHEFGQPPVDLIGDEPGAMPQLPGMADPSQCSLM